MEGGRHIGSLGETWRRIPCEKFRVPARRAVERSLADDFDQDPLRSPSVELAVENPLPGTEVELARRDRDDDFASHDLALVVCVRVVFTRSVVLVARRARIVGSKLLEPALVVLVKPRLVVVDEHARGDVHRVHEAEALSHAALPNGLFDFARDVHEIHTMRDVEGKRLPEMLHPADYSGTRPPSTRTMLTRSGRAAMVLSCRTPRTHRFHRCRSTSRTTAREWTSSLARPIRGAGSENASWISCWDIRISSPYRVSSCSRRTSTRSTNASASNRSGRWR